MPRINSVSPAFVALACIFLASAAHAKKNPGQRTAALVAAFMKVKALPEDGSELSTADKASNKKAFATLDTYFDFDAMGAEIIRPHKEKYNKSQTAHLKDTFRQLIRLVAYPRSGAFLKSAKRTPKKWSEKGKRGFGPLYLEVEEDDIEMDVVFIWEGQKEWLLMDVSFDGAKLSIDYQNQFGRIIGKVGVDGLLKKLDKRLKKELDSSVL